MPNPIEHQDAQRCVIDPRQEWATPSNFWNVINAEFYFQLDAAASAHNAKCPLYITAAENALDPNVPWVRPEEGIFQVWCNPGFSNMGPWMKRAWCEAQKAYRADVVVMGLVAPSTAWWNEWAEKSCEIRLLAPRVQFDPAPGLPRSSNPRENALFIFRRNPLSGRPQINTWRWNEAAAFRRDIDLIALAKQAVEGQ